MYAYSRKLIVKEYLTMKKECLMLYTKIVPCKKKNFKVGRNYGEYYNNLKIYRGSANRSIFISNDIYLKSNITIKLIYVLRLVIYSFY